MCKTYAEAFWGGDLSSCAGYEALVKRNYNSKKMCQELEEYLKKRAKLEADYSKHLQNLAKGFKQKEEVGLLEKAINTFRAEIEAMAQCHVNAATIFHQQSDNVRRFKENQIAQRKALEEQLHKSQSSKLTQLYKTVQLEKTYFRKFTERDLAEQNFKEMNTQRAPPKELEKARNKATKAEEEAKKSDTAYRSAVKTLESCRALWEKDMTLVCQSVQDLDEKRITFLRQELWHAANTNSKLALDMDNSSEAVREVLEDCDINLDIEAFIQMAKTGENHPEPFMFRHYTKIAASQDDADPYCTI